MKIVNAIIDHFHSLSNILSAPFPLYNVHYLFIRFKCVINARF